MLCPRSVARSGNRRFETRLWDRWYSTVGNGEIVQRDHQKSWKVSEGRITIRAVLKYLQNSKSVPRNLCDDVDQRYGKQSSSRICYL